MLRRKPTLITLTAEDIAAYDDHRAALRNQRENIQPHNTTGSGAAKGDGKKDPNDELKPLPADRPRVRSGAGREREDRIVGR